MSVVLISKLESTCRTGFISLCFYVLPIAIGDAMAQVPTDPFQYARDSVIEHDPLNGRVSAIVVQPNHPQSCLRTEYSYDDYGNRRKVVQKNCSGATGVALFATRETRGEHLAEGATPAGLSPTLLVDAENHTEHIEVSASFGRAVNRFDANGLKSSVTLDEFGRRLVETLPDGNRHVWSYVLCGPFGVGDPACSTSVNGAVISYIARVTPQSAVGVQNGPAEAVYFDTEEREVRREVEAFGAGQVRTMVYEKKYDEAGRLARETGPYFAGDVAYEWVEYTYDAIGRIKTETKPQPNSSSGLAVATTDYSARKIVQTNALGQTLTKEHDEYDRVIRITDIQGNQISYLPDAFGNLVSIRDPKGNVSSARYNFRGQRVGMDDPDMGSWNYDVDAMGQVVGQTSPKQLTSTMTYDRIGRLKRRLEPDLDSFWYFDLNEAGTACGVSANQLCETKTTTGYRQSYTFDALSRLTSTSFTFESGANGKFTSKVQYNSDGRVDQQTWPSGLAVKRIFNDRGVLLELRNAATNKLYWKRLENNPRGDAVRVALGNDLTETRDVDRQTGNVLGIESSGGAGIVLLQRFGYNALNNLTSRSDFLLQLEESFGYDRLNRLAAQVLSSPGGSREVSFQYDVLGNMVGNSDVGSYIYGAAQGGRSRPHAVAEIAGQAGKLSNPKYYYDANGNIETVTGSNGSVRNHVWTSFDMPQKLSLSNADVSSSFWYGPEHQRVRQTVVKNGQSRTILYMHPDNEGGLYFERELQGTGGVATNRHFLTADNNVTLQIESPGDIASDPVPLDLAGLQYRYWHKDHLGSIVAVTDGAGGVLERLSYDPFGKRRTATGAFDQQGSIDATTTKRGFTGHEHLDELDYVHLNARIYDPDIGRFLSADPTVPSIHQLQSFNRYSYARNNPLNRIDPNGFEDAAAGESSEQSSSLGNSLSKDSVEKATKDLANGKSNSPTQVNAKAPKAQAGEEDERTTFNEGARRAHQAGKDAAVAGEFVVDEGFKSWSIGKFFGLVGKAFSTAKAAMMASKPAAAAEQVAVKAEATLPQVNVYGKTPAERAKELHSLLPSFTQTKTTTAVVTTKEGITVVSSSERRLRPVQRRGLGPNEVEGVGEGHAEVTAMNAAEEMGLTPTGVAASRPVCGGCFGMAKEKALEILSAVKNSMKKK